MDNRPQKDPESTQNLFRSHDKKCLQIISFILCSAADAAEQNVDFNPYLLLLNNMANTLINEK